MSEAYAESPLHYLQIPDHRDSHSGVTLEELAQLGFLNLRGNVKDPEFGKAVETVAGVPVPDKPGTFCSGPQCSIYWQGPSEWLVTVPAGREAELENGLREALQGHFAVTDVSGGFCQISLQGEAVPALLKKASAYDFDPRIFDEGRCASTVVAKTTALVSRHSGGAFKIIVRRSCAHYLGRWLIDAAREFNV
jgi:heterotetrameric sarcosine oxidase gamma subunit